MQKDFQKWHGEKSALDKDKVRPFFHEREIWFASLGANIGFEQDGRGGKFLRPIVVIKKFNNEVCWGVPLTKKQKKGAYYFSFEFDDRKKSTAIISQVRLIDAKRLQYKIGDTGEKDFSILKQKIAQLLA